MIDLFIAFSLSGAVLMIIKLFSNAIKKPVVYIVEDSESDISLFKLNKTFEKYDVHYFRSLESIGFKIVFNSPDAVIVDYMLKGKTTGDELFKLCEANDIPVKLVTAYDGEIWGIPKSAIIKKEAGNNYFQQINEWLLNATGV